MKKYRRIPEIIEAYQWDGKYNDQILFYPVNPRKCALCNKSYTYHGLIDTGDGGDIICPGDWIIKDIKGEYYPVKPAFFEETYEEV